MVLGSTSQCKDTYFEADDRRLNASAGLLMFAKQTKYCTIFQYGEPKPA